MLTWLKQVRMVRRDAAPEPDLLPELFRSAAGKFTCPTCQVVGLRVADVDDQEDDNEAWGMARACDVCGKPIASERLEALPDATLCTACQSGADRGESFSAAEYCPRCGNVMALRKTTSGLTRYVMTCPQCRR